MRRTRNFSCIRRDLKPGQPFLELFLDLEALKQLRGVFGVWVFAKKL